MNQDEEQIKVTAIAFAKQHKKRIADELTNPAVYAPDDLPTSIFMAGSPGAGKTEFSKGLVSKEDQRRVVRIDADEIRSQFPGYTGTNSYLFQSAVSLVVEKIHDYALQRKQTFILDGTFSKYDKAVENIKRSLAKKRPVFIFYLYQEPQVAWRFTQVREQAEGRNIPKAAFIEQFLHARAVIERIREEFDKEVSIFLVKKDFIKNTEKPIEIEPKSKKLDEYVPEHYTKEKLEKLL